MSIAVEWRSHPYGRWHGITLPLRPDVWNYGIRLEICAEESPIDR
jgi:hypothetical protein